MYKIISLSILLLFVSKSFSQLVLRQNDWSLEFKGYSNFYYNYRFVEKGQEKHKNRFRTSDARLTFEFDYGRKVNAQIQLDFANVPTSEESNLLVDSWIQHRGDWFKLRFGQQKVPYSLISIFNKPSLAISERPFLIDIMTPRRDVGITFHQFFWGEKLLLWQGIFTGNGKNQKDDDAKGKPLFAARVQYSFPHKSSEATFNSIPSIKPVFSFGANATFSDDQRVIEDENLFRNLEGEKLLYGVDFSVAYRQFKFIWEFHRADFKPDATKEFSAGGSFYELSANFKKINSLFAVRYEDVNPNSLLKNNNQKALDFATTHFLEGLPTQVRVTYSHRFEVERTKNKWKDNELRAEIIFNF